MTSFMAHSWRTDGAKSWRTHGAFMAQNTSENLCGGPGCDLRHENPLKGGVFMATGPQPDLEPEQISWRTSWRSHGANSGLVETPNGLGSENDDAR